MPKRTPLQSVVVHRENKDDPKKPLRIIPEVGKPFEFTAEEIKHIEKANPDALSTKAVVDLTEDGKPLGTSSGEGSPDGDDTQSNTAETTNENVAKTAGKAAAKSAKASSKDDL